MQHQRQELRRRFKTAGSSATAFSVNPGAVRCDIYMAFHPQNVDAGVRCLHEAAVSRRGEGQPHFRVHVNHEAGEPLRCVPAEGHRLREDLYLRHLAPSLGRNHRSKPVSRSLVWYAFNTFVPFVLPLGTGSDYYQPYWLPFGLTIPFEISAVFCLLQFVSHLRPMGLSVLCYQLILIPPILHFTVVYNLVHVDYTSKLTPGRVLLFLFWCPYVVINVSVQYNGGFLPEIVLLTLCDYIIGEPF